MELVKYLLNALVLSLLLAAGSVPFETCFDSRFFTGPVPGEDAKFLTASEGWPVVPVSKDGAEHPVVVERIGHSVQVVHLQLVQPVIFLFCIISEVKSSPMLRQVEDSTGPPELRRLFHHTISRQAP